MYFNTVCWDVFTTWMCYGKMLMLLLRINMYSEGLMDLMEMIMMLSFVTDKEPKLENIETKAKERYLPVFEKVPIHLLYIWNSTRCLQPQQSP